MTKKYDIVILGAGAGGLGAACWAKYFGLSFLVVEGLSELPLNLHNGVHYLHSKPELPFNTDLKEITLTDGILCDGVIKTIAELLDVLSYSEKVREIQHPSSIMDVGKKTSAYLPSTNSLNDYLKTMYNYTGYLNYTFNSWVQSIDLINRKVTVSDGRETVEIGYSSLINTMPLKKFMELAEVTLSGELKFASTPIEITNFRVNKIVPNWLINLYVPSLKTKIYRASILNNIISVESTSKIEVSEYDEVAKLFNMFYIDTSDVGNYKWTSGKVISISSDDRRAICTQLADFDAYSIGRFGLWNRKLLIDSTINQAKAVVKYIWPGSTESREPLINLLSK